MRALSVALVLTLVLVAPAAATFPGRNGLIAVAGDGETRDSTIWVGRPNGRGLRALPTPCAGPGDPIDPCSAGDPAWSPDGARLAFSVIDGSWPQLWIVEADGTNLRPVPGAGGYGPAWSPDGQRLVFSVDRMDRKECHWRDLYTIGADGSGPQLLIRRGDRPDWSVRGEIVYERLHEYWTSGDQAGCEPRSSLAVLRSGERPRPLRSRASAPSWAPDGRWVAFLDRDGLRRKRVGASGKGRLLVSTAPSVPSWSPDGRVIAYRSGRRLKMIGARRGNPLSFGFDAPGPDFSSSWQAR
jgi:dipeptidyl aminopeptidase/acylaminoacyl peptidase